MIVVLLLTLYVFDANPPAPTDPPAPYAYTETSSVASVVTLYIPGVEYAKVRTNDVAGSPI
jgi:hypothetical protein